MPRGTAGAPPPYTDSQVKALPGIGVSWQSPNGPRQATSGSNGDVSLGKLGPGSHELTINQKILGAGTGNKPAVLGLLLPAVQNVREGARRYVTVVVTPVNDQPTLRIKVDVDAKGQVSNINWGNGIGVNVAVGDINGDGQSDLKLFEDLAKRNTSGETKLAFVLPLARMGTGPGGPSVPAPAGLRGGFIIPLIAVVALQGPGGASVGTGKTDNTGQIAFQNLPAGRYTARLEGKDLPAGTSGPVTAIATVNGTETARTTFDVPAGGASTRSFDLPFDVGPPPPGLTGTTAVVSLLVPAGIAEANSALQEVSKTPLGTSQGNAGTPVTGTPPAPALDPLTDGLLIIRYIGVTATGPSGVRQTRSDGEGWTRFDKLPIGNTILEFSGADLASALKATVGPNTPQPQKTLIELLVVIAIVAIKTDGMPVVFTGSVPASAVKTLKADLRVGRDGNLMDVDFGNGPQLPQTLTKTGPGTLILTAPNGVIPLSPAFVKSLQDRADKAPPGMVEANTAMLDVSTTR
ncbi:MAG: hypothetical protein PSV46_24145 [Reyranella sp.]|nr:hypothetical protein [Reyranella sp.]